MVILVLLPLIAQCKKTADKNSKPLTLAEIKRSDQYLEFQPMVVNLNEKQMSYLRVDLGFMLATKVGDTEKALRLKARDRMIVRLSGLTVEQLEASDAQKKVEVDLIAIAEKIYGKNNVEQVIVSRWQMR